MSTRGSGSASMDFSVSPGGLGPRHRGFEAGHRDLFLNVGTWEPLLGFSCLSVDFRIQASIASHISDSFKEKIIFPEFKL